MNTTTAVTTGEAIRSVFAAYGLPRVVVTDNGPQFRLHEFECFVKENGFSHPLTPPYHPQSNGAVEKSVQTKKKHS